jgi:hypothetical protein
MWLLQRWEPLNRFVDGTKKRLILMQRVDWLPCPEVDKHFQTRLQGSILERREVP